MTRQDHERTLRQTGVTVSDKTLDWLRDAPAASAEALAALTAQPPEPEPIPPEPEPIPPEPLPPSEDGMDYPKNESELRACIQGYCDQNIVGMLDPRTAVEVSSTLVMKQTSNAGRPWGFNGNYGLIRYVGPAGQDLIRAEGVNGQSNRGFTIKNVTLDGGDPNQQGAKARTCLHLSAPLGDPGPLYKFNIENVYTMFAQYGFELEGGVYEGWMMNCHAENMSKDGTWMYHTNLGTQNQGVVSNILMIHPNMSRNFGAGIRSVYSVYILGGSYIINGDGGVQAPDGLRGMILSNGENTAGKEGAAFVVPNNGYGSVINLCEGSSDGATVCRRWTGSAWVDVGSPMLYLMAIGQGVAQADNHVSYYGGGSNPMRVVK